MKPYYELEPEVPGQLGENSIINTNIHPPIVTELDFVFDGWLGDEIIECFPCYMIAENIKNQIDNENFTGFKIANFSVSVSALFRELHPEVSLPKFYWLQITGEKEVSDFWLSEKHILIVSEAALEFLKAFRIGNCEIRPYLTKA